ncbi:GNAT family N-acetyltransferase [Shewanella sp. SR43-4]|uniref:GNAT family N-acetyltransferase n=1 Tax=Shewanella sp. SR43-4 TaxID=2760942 RepID=UPI0015FE09CF|nr:GNAT family N-acetyltransferase [Shewanella sp. SR43-4]MBB1318432.1 GNAT family N-acetyltransferase [Shewanella sp. SR43-4]
MFKIEITSGIANTDFSSLAENRCTAHKHSYLESDDWVDWKFNKSPFGRSIVALVRNDKAEVIACNAYGILEYKIGNKEFKVAKPYETFVHADYQGKGLFSKMLTKIREEAINQKLDGLLFFPNEQSLNSLKKSKDWMELKTPIRYFISPRISFSTLFNLIDIKKLFVPLRSSEQQQRLFDFKGNNLQNSKILKLNTSSDYLKWRFNPPTINLYRKFTGKNTEIVIREGKRGRLKEAQVVFIGYSVDFNSKSLKNELLNSFRILHKEFDLVGVPISVNNDLISILGKLKFLSLPSRTNVFIQPISDIFKENIEKLALSGLDFHTY